MRVGAHWLLYGLDTTGRVAPSRLVTGKIRRVSDLGSYTQTCTYCIAATKGWMLCQKAIKLPSLHVSVQGEKRRAATLGVNIRADAWRDSRLGFEVRHEREEKKRDVDVNWTERRAISFMQHLIPVAGTRKRKQTFAVF